MKQSAIAAMIERDLLRRDTEKGRVETSHCALCEAGMVYRGRDYCSPRCAQYAADGFPAPDPTYARKAINVSLRSWTIVAGPPDVAVGSAYYADVLARYFDAGHSRTNPTSEGFKITCRGCQKEFVSRGQRYCSPECGRRDRERQGNLAIMAEVGTLSAKRCCAQCGARIPSWRNGRKVSSATRFCSDACAQKARRECPILLMLFAVLESQAPTRTRTA